MSRNIAGLMTYHKAVIGVVAFILALPIVATVLYAFSSSWGATILPDGLTFRWFAQLLTDPGFLQRWEEAFSFALQRSSSRLYSCCR